MWSASPRVLPYSTPGFFRFAISTERLLSSKCKSRTTGCYCAPGGRSSDKPVEMANSPLTGVPMGTSSRVAHLAQRPGLGRIPDVSTTASEVWAKLRSPCGGDNCNLQPSPPLTETAMQ